MMKKILFPALLLVSFSVHAETNYVSDEFEITMRTGQGAKHKILKTLATGTRLEVLQRDEEQGYTRVRTSDGTEGWVLSRYLLNKPVAKQRLVSANRRISSLKKDLNDNKNALKELRSQHASLQKQYDTARGNSNSLQQELQEIKQISSKEISLHDENEKLKTDLLTMERKLQTLHQDNLALKDKSARDWFMVGAGVLVFGILLGLVLPRLRGKKSAGWSSI